MSIIPNKCWSDFIFLYPFFCTGILMKEYKESILRYAERFLIISTVTFVICMSYWKGYSDTFYSMNTSMLAEEGYAGITGWMVPVKMIYRYITGVSASFMLILLARRLEVYLPTSPLVMRIGRNTLGIYILHGFVFQIFAPTSSNVLFENKVISFIACFLISSVLTVVCNYIVVLTSRSRWLALVLWGGGLYKNRNKLWFQSSFQFTT